MQNNPFGYNQNLPEAIRDIFMWLCQDVAALQQKWSFYLELFSDEETTELLSNLALASFQIIEESLRDDMTMAICRLSDPVRSGGQDNLSFKTLFQRLDEHHRPSELLEEFLEACEPVRIIRNKQVSHNDLDTTIKPQDNPLPGIGRAHIERIIKLAERILNKVYERFVDSQLSFRLIHIGGADALLFWLRMGKEYDMKKTNLELDDLA